MTKQMAVRVAIALFLAVTFSQVSLAQFRGFGDKFGDRDDNRKENRNDNRYEDRYKDRYKDRDEDRYKDRDEDRYKDRDEDRYDHGYRRWEYLGESYVDGRFDHDVIEVGRDEGRFRALQIRVSNAPIFLQRVVVHYGNGTSEVVNFRDRIPAGGQTRIFDLRGYHRAIESVEFFYARGFGGFGGFGWWGSWARPNVRLYGR